MFFLTLALVFVTTMYVVATFWLYRAQTDPDVVVFATDDEVEQTLIWIVVQNVGRSVASDISFRWNFPPVTKAAGLTEEEAAKAPDPVSFKGPLIKGIRQLGPGSRRAFIWGQYGGIARSLAAVPDRELHVVCEFYGGHTTMLGNRRHHRREYTLDVASFDESITRDAPIRKIHRETEKIAKALTSLATVATTAARHSSASRPQVQKNAVANEIETDLTPLLPQTGDPDEGEE